MARWPSSCAVSFREPRSGSQITMPSLIVVFTFEMRTVVVHPPELGNLVDDRRGDDGLAGKVGLGDCGFTRSQRRHIGRRVLRVERALFDVRGGTLDDDGRLGCRRRRRRRWRRAAPLGARQRREEREK
jgi:hypothetical protein